MKRTVARPCFSVSVLLEKSPVLPKRWRLALSLTKGVLPSVKGGDANGHMAGSDPVYDTVDCISCSVLSDW